VGINLLHLPPIFGPLVGGGGAGVLTLTQAHKRKFQDPLADTCEYMNKYNFHVLNLNKDTLYKADPKPQSQTHFNNHDAEI